MNDSSVYSSFPIFVTGGTGLIGKALQKIVDPSPGITTLSLDGDANIQYDLTKDDGTLQNKILNY